MSISQYTGTITNIDSGPNNNPNLRTLTIQLEHFNTPTDIVVTAPVAADIARRGLFLAENLFRFIMRYGKMISFCDMHQRVPEWIEVSNDVR